MRTTEPKTNANAATTAQLFLIEFYTNKPDGKGGFKVNEAWDINMALVGAESRTAAIEKLKAQQGARFCETIMVSESSQITALAGQFRVNTKDANLFFIDAAEFAKGGN